MSNLRETGALITGDPSEAANALADSQVVSTTFGPRIYAMHVLRGQESIMASIKGRENGKPVVITTHPSLVETALLETPSQVGIDKDTPPRVLDWFKLLLTSSDHPIGVLLPTQVKYLSTHQVGIGNIFIDGTPQRTVGFMTPGINDKEYLKFIKAVPGNFVSSTSVNKGNDPAARGSGHHRLYGIVEDFGIVDRVCIAVPADWSEETRIGVSTTTFFLNSDGARLVRIGSLSEAEANNLCREHHIPYLGEVQGGAKKIQAFDYSKRGSEGPMVEAYRYLQGRTRIESFRWTSEAESQCQMVIAQGYLAINYAQV